MKSILAIFLILSFSFASFEEFSFEEQAGMSIEEAVALVEGILDGMNVNHEVEHIKECIALVPDIIKKIKDLIEEFKKIDWKDIEKVFEIIANLFDTLKTLFLTIKPCFKIYSDIEGVIKKLSTINWDDLLKKILANIFPIFTGIVDILKKFEKKQYKAAGEGIGKLIWMLLLDHEFLDPSAEEPVEAFFRGFFVGLNAEEDYKKILKCIKNAEQLILKIVEAIKKIATLKIKEVIEGLKMLVEAVKELITMIFPCLENTEKLKRLLEAIMNIDFLKIAWKIITNIGSLIKFITEVIKGFEGKDFYKVGHGLGAFLNVLFL